MIAYIMESLLAVISIVYYALSRRPEWLVLVGLVVVMMTVERLIAAVHDLIPEDVIEVNADALEWIRTDKALPPEPVGDGYLEYNVVIDHRPVPTTLEYRGGGEWAERGGGVPYEVKYWREMPEMPEEEVKNEQSNLNT